MSSGWRSCAAFESSPEERSASGSLRACLSERSEFAGPPLARVPQGWHFSARRRRRRSCVSRCALLRHYSTVTRAHLRLPICTTYVPR